MQFIDLFGVTAGNVLGLADIAEISTADIESIGRSKIIIEHRPLGSRALLNFIHIHRSRVGVAFPQKRQHLMMPGVMPEDLVINKGQITVISINILGQCGTDLLQVALAAGSMSCGTGLVQGRQQHGCKNGDNRDHDQKFNQCKRAFHIISFPCLSRVYNQL